jgi:hypothetical protein
MAGWGFDFVRLPMAYPRFVNFDPSKNITPDDVYNINEKEVDKIQALVEMANRQGLHVSLNLHRAPGFCVNAGFNEPYNLWQDKEAQEAFYFHWGMWAKRFAGLSRDQIRPGERTVYPRRYERPVLETGSHTGSAVSRGGEKGSRNHPAIQPETPRGCRRK